MVCTFCINKLKSDWNPSIELNFQEQIVVLKECDNYSGVSLVLSSLQVFSLSVDVVNMFLWLFFFCNKNNNMYLSQLVCLHHRDNSRWSDLSRNIQLQAERLSVIVKWQFLQKKKGRRDFTSGFVFYHTWHIHVQYRHVFFCKTFISLPDNLYKNMKSKSNLICLVIVSDKQINKKLNNFEKRNGRIQQTCTIQNPKKK